MKRQVILLIVAIIFCLNGTAYATWENDLSLARNAALPTTTNQTPLGKLATDILVGTNPISESCKAVQQNYSSTRHKAAVQIAGMIVRNRKVDQEIRQTAAELRSLAHISATFSNTSTASKQLLAVMKHPYHEAKKRCDKSIIELEHELRQVGRELEIEIAELSKKVASPKEEDKDQAIKTNLLKDQKALALVRDTISYVDSDSLLRAFDDYEGFYYKLNLGFEYATVKTIFQKGFPRIGFLIYHQYTPEYAQKRDRMPGWKIGEVHTSLAARLTSSAEAPTKENPGTGDPTINLGDKPSLEYDIQTFFPVRKTMNFGNLWSEIGPLLLYGGSKTDDINQIHQRYYGGVRLAMNPETYTDVLFGKSEGLRSQRLEIRGQMPIYRTTAGAPFVIGAIANLGVRKANSETYKEADSIRIYVSWDVDVKDIFKVFNAPSK